MQQAFFKFYLDKPVKHTDAGFAISVLQQGDRLKNYRLGNRKQFDPAKFNIILMTEKGKFVNACFGGSFMYSLMNNQVDLEKGGYIFMVDPIWNHSSELSEDYKEILVDVYAPEIVDLETIDDQAGIMFLEQALKDAARTVASPENKQFYLKDDTDYGEDVYRVQDVQCLDCWYGFIMTQNNSKYPLREVVLPQLQGLEVVWPPNQQEDGTFNLEMAPKSDHIIILRRTEDACSFGLKYMTHPRPMTDAEMVEETKQIQEFNQFGEYNVFYRLFNNEIGACFLFENHEKDRKFTTQFELQLQNLKIVGDEESHNFEVNLDPGKSKHVILRPIIDGEFTSMQMRYAYELTDL